MAANRFMAVAERIEARVNRMAAAGLTSEAGTALISEVHDSGGV